MQEAADVVGQLLDGIEDVSAIVEAGGGFDRAGMAFDSGGNEYILKIVIPIPGFPLDGGAVLEIMSI
jgi:hypothetical protein